MLKNSMMHLIIRLKRSKRMSLKEAAAKFKETYTSLRQAKRAHLLNVNIMDIKTSPFLSEIKMSMLHDRITTIN